MDDEWDDAPTWVKILVTLSVPAAFGCLFWLYEKFLG
jgi:hypothetical protein